MTLEFVKSDAIDARHGFFTRIGGVSAGIYAGLNCGLASRDDPAAIAKNRTFVANEFDGIMPQNPSQVHSPDVAIISKPMAERPTADAVVTNAPGLPISILTADCAPVLFFDPNAKVAGAAHAGWKGALGGVLEATIDAMVTQGAQRQNINAVVGPTISQRAYEVGPEFQDAFMDDDPENSRFFAGGSGDRVQFDLPSFALFKLRNAGVGYAEWTGHCTYGDPKRFFSYRRSTHHNEPDYGRMISVICL